MFVYVTVFTRKLYKLTKLYRKLSIDSICKYTYMYFSKSSSAYGAADI